jgi:RNA polymerase sigma-70 factor (ECF subfamily)
MGMRLRLAKRLANWSPIGEDLGEQVGLWHEALHGHAFATHQASRQLLANWREAGARRIASDPDYRRAADVQPYSQFNALANARIVKGGDAEPTMDKHADADESLMAQVAQGKREALEALVRRHAAALLLFIQRMVGDRHIAEDLFQEVFLAVWSKRWQYDRSRPFRPWLYAIAVNQCRAAFRRRPAVAPVSLDDGQVAPVAPGPAPLETAVAEETAVLVNRAITRLPPQQRAVVALRFLQHLSYGEIAEILECGEATVRSHMHHGLCTLRKYLELWMG